MWIILQYNHLFIEYCTEAYNENLLGIFAVIFPFKQTALYKPSFHSRLMFYLPMQPTRLYDKLRYEMLRYEMQRSTTDRSKFRHSIIKVTLCAALWHYFRVWGLGCPKIPFFEVSSNFRLNSHSIGDKSVLCKKTEFTCV